MRHCKKCLMPDTRPGSVFNSKGVCQACLNYEARSRVDWKKRWNELKKICDKYRRNDGYYDCIIPVSGGKDSHYLAHVIKMEMGMNPLLVTVGDPFTKTEAGLKNYRNLGDTFGCDHILFDISIDLFRKVTIIGFEEFGEPLRFVEAALYTTPFNIAVKMGIPFVIYGEDSSYQYGSTDKEAASAVPSIFDIFKAIDLNFWIKKGISKKELNPITPPKEGELKEVKPEVIFMSYFTPWSSTRHLEIARRYGFRDLTHEWIREGFIENFEQIDSVAYVLNIWLKYPKFGFQRTSDIVSRRVREGKVSIEEAKRLIMENDHKLDQRALDDFTAFIKYTPKQFWDTVERFWNHKIFEKIDGVLTMKDPAYKDLIKKRRT